MSPIQIDAKRTLAVPTCPFPIGLLQPEPNPILPRVLLLRDHDNLSGDALMAGLSARGCAVRSVLRSRLTEQLPQIDVCDFDIILGYGPHNGSILGLELLHGLLQERCRRPLFIWWVVENLPDPRIPDQITKCLSGLRVTADRWRRHLPGRAEIDDYRFTAGLLGAGQRFRIVGELRRLVSKGIVDLVVASGERRCELLRRQGIAAQPLFFGYTSNFGKDLELARDIDVAFLGQPGSMRRRRHLGKVTRALERRDISVTVHDGRSGSLDGAALVQFLNRCRILLNILRGPRDAVFHRFLLGAANKALIVTEPVSDYGPFVPGVHLVASPVDDMADTIQRLLRHEDERRSRIEAAYRLVTENETMEASVGRLLMMFETLGLGRV